MQSRTIPHIVGGNEVVGTTIAGPTTAAASLSPIALRLEDGPHLVAARAVAVVVASLITPAATDAPNSRK